MSGIQKKIVNELCRRLSDAEGFTETMVQELRKLLEAEKKAKPADVIAVLSSGAEEVT